MSLAKLLCLCAAVFSFSAHFVAGNKNTKNNNNINNE